MTARKPTNMRILHGETRPSRINRNEPRPRQLLPEPPDWLSPDARAVWDRILPELAHMRLVTAADRDALVVYCQAVAHHAQAVREVNERGLLVPGREGNLVKNPACQFVREQAVLVKVMGQQFGLTPAARVSLPGDTSEEGPGWDLLT